MDACPTEHLMIREPVPVFPDIPCGVAESSPTHGAVLRASPDQVVLHFDAILEPSITQVNLIDLREGFTRSSPLMGED